MTTSLEHGPWSRYAKGQSPPVRAQYSPYVFDLTYY